MLEHTSDFLNFSDRKLLQDTQALGGKVYKTQQPGNHG